VVWIYSSGLGYSGGGGGMGSLQWFKALKSLSHFELSAEQIILRTHFSCPALIDFD
jgi:hypothetical protein